MYENETHNGVLAVSKIIEQDCNVRTSFMDVNDGIILKAKSGQKRFKCDGNDREKEIMGCNGRDRLFAPQRALTTCSERWNSPEALRSP